MLHLLKAMLSLHGIYLRGVGKMKLWVDDVRPAPEGYIWCKSVNEAKGCIVGNENWAVRNYSLATRELEDGNETGFFDRIHIGSLYIPEIIDIDHDAGDYASDGGDYIRLLDWLEETGRNYPIRIHSMNPVGVQNMRAIIRKNGWKEVF